MRGHMRRVGGVLVALALAGGCSGGDADGSDVDGAGVLDDGADAGDGAVRGTARGVLGPDDDGTMVVQVETADGGITEVSVPFGATLACADGSPTSWPEVTGLGITASGDGGEVDAVVVDC